MCYRIIYWATLIVKTKPAGHTISKYRLKLDYRSALDRYVQPFYVGSFFVLQLKFERIIFMYISVTLILVFNTSLKAIT